MRFGVLCSDDSWYLQDLRRAAGAEHELVPLAFERLAVRLERHTTVFEVGEFELESFDAVLVRTMPPGTLEQVVFRMDVLGRIEMAGQVVINPPRAIEAAVDKYLALAKLRQAGLPVPRTCCCQTAADAMAQFEQMGCDVVIKPLFGSEGRGITRVTDEALAMRAFKLLAQMGAVIYLQEFVPHEGYDTRVLVIGDETYAMRRRHAEDWRTNVARGATCEAIVPTEQQSHLALTAARAVGAPLAGVDLLHRPEGETYVIEVNAVPGWKALAQACQVDVARCVLDFLRRAVDERARQRHPSAARNESEIRQNPDQTT
jgi:ribosomal protein S6--L-glutamate ligase